MPVAHAGIIHRAMNGRAHNRPAVCWSKRTAARDLTSASQKRLKPSFREAEEWEPLQRSPSKARWRHFSSPSVVVESTKPSAFHRCGARVPHGVTHIRHTFSMPTPWQHGTWPPMTLHSFSAREQALCCNAGSTLAWLRTLPPTSLARPLHAAASHHALSPKPPSQHRCDNSTGSNTVQRCGIHIGRPDMGKPFPDFPNLPGRAAPPPPSR